MGGSDPTFGLGQEFCVYISKTVYRMSRSYRVKCTARVDSTSYDDAADHAALLLKALLTAREAWHLRRMRKGHSPTAPQDQVVLGSFKMFRREIGKSVNEGVFM